MKYFLQIVVSIVFVLGVLGWIMNFWNLFQYEFPAQEFILSVIGIFVPPLGCNHRVFVLSVGRSVDFLTIHRPA